MFVLAGKMLVVDDLVDLVFAIFVVHFMRKIAGKHEWLVAHGFN